MLKKFLTILTLISITTLFTNGLTRANLFKPLPSTLTAEDKKPCSTCSAGLQSNSAPNALDNLATLGRRTQVTPFAPVQRSAFEGATVNFVGTATGHLAFAVTDLELNGPMPIVFQRIYASDQREDAGLGMGWSFSFDDRITLAGEAATMTSAGSVIAFRREGKDGRFVLKTDEPILHQSFDIIDNNTIAEQAGGLTRTYRKLGDAYRLSQIADPNGNNITISFDERGNLSRITSSSGGALMPEWSDDKDARLLAISDNTGRRVAFKQNGRSLRALIDPSGAQWTYDYSDGRLMKVNDPTGRVLLRARYDRRGRATESGDAVGVHQYEYDAHSANASRRTTVIDPMGAKTFFEHHKTGALAAISDGEGGTALFQYSAANRLTRVSNQFGDEMKYDYDAQNRLLRQSSSDGAEQSYDYDERGQVSSATNGSERTEYARDARGQIVSAKSDGSAGRYTASLNSRGQIASLKSSNREISFEYDANGNNSAFTYSDVGRFSLERDAAGRVTMERLPSGLEFYNEYDARGWPSKQSDNRGRSTIMERDASGAPVGYTRSDGRQMRAVRDEAGRVIAVTGFDGSVRRYAYNARGALTDYTDARGKQRKYEYDGRGRLKNIIDDSGKRTTIERDERGRVRRVASTDGTRLRYDYDRRGNVSIMRESGAKISIAMYDIKMSHATLQEDDNLGDSLIIDVWGQLWGVYPINGGLLGGGGMVLPEQNSGHGGSGGSETREQCIARHRHGCDLQFYGCLGLVVSGGIIFFATCDLATLIVGTPACAVLLGVVGVVGAGACVLNGLACLNNAQDGCPP